MVKKKDKIITYSKAITELESILDEIESEEIDMDILTDKVKRASCLIKFCNDKLKQTEEEVKKVLTNADEASMEKESK